MSVYRTRFYTVAALTFIALAALLLMTDSPSVGAQHSFGESRLADTQPLAAGQVIDATAVITIGVAAPFSGGVEWLGIPVSNSVQLALQDAAPLGINLGGITHTVVMVYADDGCNGTDALTAAAQLINQRVSAVVGHPCSLAHLSAAPVWDAAGIPIVSPSATRVDLTLQGYTTTFRVISSDSAPPRLLAEYAYTYMGRRQAAIIDAAYAFYSPMLADEFSSAFEALGGSVISRITIDDIGLYTDTLQSIALADPDVIYLTDPDMANAALVKAIAASLGLGQTPLLLSPMTEDKSVLQAYARPLGHLAATDVVAMSYRHPDDMPGWEAYRTAYVGAYGEEPMIFGAFAYDAARIILAAAQRAGSADPGAIRGEIAATTNHEGVVGTYVGFDEHGDVIPQWAWLEWFILNNIYLPLATRG